jgi:hypothetical protein
MLGVILAATGMQAQSNPFDALRNPRDPRFYEEHKAQWLVRVEALPQNVDVLEGAADFFIIPDRQLAQDLLERPRALEPNSPRWPRKLAQLHKLNAAPGDQSEARLALAKASPKSWDYGNAVHKGRLVLGRIAVREGRIVDAVWLLRASGETLGSSQLISSFGPNMSLAKDLLEHREIDAVLAYLEQCRVFWKMGGDKLDAWVQEVKAGRVPNFGANLHY